MKRLPIAILALLAGGCQRPPAPAPAPVQDRPRAPGPESAAYAAARKFVLADLEKRYGPGLGGWSLPDAVTEANMVRDYKRPDDYQVALTAYAPGREFRSYVVSMRRAGDDWRLERIVEDR